MLNGIPVFFAISNKSSTTGFNNGILSLLLTASASISGSPGIKGPLDTGACFVFSKDLNPVLDLFFELVFVDEAIDPGAAPCVARGGFDYLKQRTYDPRHRRIP